MTEQRNVSGAPEPHKQQQSEMPQAAPARRIDLASDIFPASNWPKDSAGPGQQQG